jgi:Fe-S cluster assembly protein SufD
MNTVSIHNDLQTIADLFESSFDNIPGGAISKGNRREAFGKFIDLGFPLKSNEEYKYSSTEKLFKNEFNWISFDPNKPQIDYASYRKNNLDANHIFLVNGQLIANESDLNIENKDCIICDLKTAAQEHSAIFEKYYGVQVNNFKDAFAQLNTAMASNGLLIYIAPNAQLQRPIQINNINYSSTNQVFQTHHIIVAEQFSNVSIVETFYSENASEPYLLNTVAEVTVKQSAFVNYYKLQSENDLAIQINTTQVLQEQQSHFDTNTVTLGGKWMRNNLNIVLNGTHCTSHLNGLQLLSKQQHVDNHTLVDHQMPHCESNQLYKGILNDKSTGVFNGKIFVRKDAQKTNAYQSSKNMLLSDDATMNTKPQLEIYADDVKCSHGSSTGQIDENAVFYLRARGISPDSAKSLLMYAFAIDVIQTIKIESYRNYLDSLIEKHFQS